MVLNWNFFHPVNKVLVDAGTHGSVQEKLIDKGELPDPFVGLNESLFNWIEEHEWVFSSEFEITTEMLSKDFIDLEFPGIDTYADIYLNDSLIGIAENAFKPYRYEVKSLLKQGLNKLKVIFYPPVLYHKENYKKAKYKLPAPNDVNEIAIAPYTRKPQYQFGWDWSMRMNTIGFLKPVKINSYNTAHVIATNIFINEINNNNAVVEFELNIGARISDTLFWKSELFGEIKYFGNESFMLKREEIIQNPKLWWPRGQGDQFLYLDEWTLYNSKREVLFTKKVRFGLKKSELIQETDKWGTSYVIKVNDRPIFCKGADYIPQDIFPSRVKDADLRKMVETMAESNFNMVRVWGGGYYPDEEFYNACDELGIMVWQDFMFACAMYPGDPDFIQNVREEVQYQIPRIASHACLTIFNGNNEVDVAWKNWGFQVKYGLYGKDADEIEQSYDHLFKTVLPATVSKLSNAPYIHTSPLSNWGKDEFYNHGSQHYWGVWHGKDPLSNFGKKIGRFNAEYGFQSFPEFSTLSKFSDKKDWELESEVMKNHQKSYVGNGMILKHAELLYGKPENFEDFVYYSQLTQATAVSMAVSGHRIDAPRCMGTLYWQLNDCWPAPTWSSLDYYGNWKALQYTVKDDYEDVAVIRKTLDDGKYDYYLVSDQIDTFMCEVYYTVFDLDGKEIVKTNASQLIRGNESEKICDSCLKKDLANQNCVIRFDWENANGEKKKRTFSQLPVVYKKAESSDISIEFGSIDPISKTAILFVRNKKYVRNFWLYSSKGGVKFNTNFVDLIPGLHEFQIEFEQLPLLSDFNYKWM
jgi:beta-mannosidase